MLEISICFFLAAYGEVPKEKWTKEITSIYKQNSEEIPKKPGLAGLENNYFSHISKSLQPSKYSHGEKWSQGRDQIMDAAITPFVKMCEIFKLVFGRLSQLNQKASKNFMTLSVQ